MNAAETLVHSALIEDGWKVLRRGWPDFLCVRVRENGQQEILGVEVKAQNDRISTEQRTLHEALVSAGISVRIARHFSGLKKTIPKSSNQKVKQESLPVVEFTTIGPERKCAARDCEIRFTPRLKGQIFHSRRCYNRESQRLYR